MAKFSKTKDGLEQEILALLKAGDTKAINLLHTHYSDTLYGVILRIVARPELAKEVLQDSLVKIWKHADKYQKNKGRLFTWMINIARNTAIDYMRSARAGRQARTDNIDITVYKNEQLTTELRLEDSGLQKVISSLDEKHRLLIDLVYFRAYTQSEIAKEFDIPLGTVKSRLRLAIMELRKKLSDEKLKGILMVLLIFEFLNLIS